MVEASKRAESSLEDKDGGGRKRGAESSLEEKRRRRGETVT
jgi:hypothetical protein